MGERLQKSIAKYREVLAHAEQLAGILTKGDPKLLAVYMVRLNELQAEASLNDQPLLEELAQDSARLQLSPLLQERTQLLKQIMEMNDLLLPRIRGMMSVTAAELAQLKDGRVAVSGYQQAPVRSQGSIRGVG